MKRGQRVTVNCLLNGKSELATVMPITKKMLPLPDGYVPIKFDVDGARLLTHKSRLEYV